MALSQIAGDCGYRYAFIGAEQAVVLTRHDVSIKVRPGEDLYEYNDREVPVDGPTPYYADGDVFVSMDLARRFRKYVGCDSERRADTTPGGTALDGAVNSAGGLNVQGPTSIGSVSAHQIPTENEIAVQGTATPNSRVALTLRAIPSRDVPEVVVSRTRIRSDDKGKFAVVISTASLYYPGSLVRLTAETDSGNTVSVPITLEPPNHTKDVPADHEKD